MRRAAITLASGILALCVVLAAFALVGWVLRLATNLRPQPRYRVTWLEKR